MKHAARPTSAAPTYFEPALIRISGAVTALFDGGVFINWPTFSTYADAMKIFPDEKEFFCFIAGNAELIRPISHAEAKHWYKAGWLVPLPDCIFDGAADAAHYQMKTFRGRQYVRMQTALSLASDDMDNATDGNVENLKAEAHTLIRTHKSEFQRICEILQCE